MNSEKLISVIIPVYNAEKYIKECLSSIIDQTYKNLEIICVDDGSTDHSLELLEFYRKKDSRIKIYKQDNKGPAAARNLALEKANGDYISFVDADDTLEYNAYEVLIALSWQNDWDMIIFSGNVMGEQNDYISQKITQTYREYRDINHHKLIFQENGAKPFLWLHFIKRDLLEKPVKLRFDESLNLGEDQIFQFGYVPRAKNVLVIEDKFYNYRITQNASLMQLYKNRRVTKTEMHFQIVDQIVKDWIKFGYYETEKDELWTWAVSFIYWTIRDFPQEFRKKYAQRFMDLMFKYDFKEYFILVYEIDHYKEMKEWLINDYSVINDMKKIVEKTNIEKNEISETLKSKAYRLGKFLTLKKNRIEV